MSDENSVHATLESFSATGTYSSDKCLPLANPWLAAYKSTTRQRYRRRPASSHPGVPPFRGPSPLPTRIAMAWLSSSLTSAHAAFTASPRGVILTTLARVSLRSGQQPQQTGGRKRKVDVREATGDRCLLRLLIWHCASWSLIHSVKRASFRRLP
jgi:hypothetical protein